MKIRYHAIEDGQCLEHHKTIEVNKDATREQILEAIHNDILNHIYFIFDVLD